MIEKVKERGLENRHVGMKETAKDLNISCRSSQQILVNVLGMKRVYARLVPKYLNFLQNQCRG